MSSIQVNVDGDVEELMKRIRSMENVDFKGVLNAVGEGCGRPLLNVLKGEKPLTGAPGRSL